MTEKTAYKLCISYIQKICNAHNVCSWQNCRCVQSLVANGKN